MEQRFVDPAAGPFPMTYSASRFGASTEAACTRSVVIGPTMNCSHVITLVRKANHGVKRC